MVQRLPVDVAVVARRGLGEAVHRVLFRAYLAPERRAAVPDARTLSRACRALAHLVSPDLDRNLGEAEPGRLLLVACLAWDMEPLREVPGDTALLEVVLVEVGDDVVVDWAAIVACRLSMAYLNH